MRSQEGRVEGKNHLLSSAGHATLDADQDTDGFVGCDDALLTFVELFLNQHPQSILLSATLNPFTTQSVFVFGCVATQVHNLHLALSNFMKFPWAHLSSLSVSLWMAYLLSNVSVICTTRLGVLSKLAEDENPLSMLPTKMLNNITDPEECLHSDTQLLTSAIELILYPSIYEIHISPF